MPTMPSQDSHGNFYCKTWKKACAQRRVNAKHDFRQSFLKHAKSFAAMFILLESWLQTLLFPSPGSGKKFVDDAGISDFISS